MKVQVPIRRAVSTSIHSPRPPLARRSAARRPNPLKLHRTKGLPSHRFALGHALAMSHMDDAVNGGQHQTSNEEILRVSDVLENYKGSQFGYLADDHEVSIYLNNRLKVLFPDHHQDMRVRVSENMDEPNAFSLANGTIIVSKGLLKLMRTVGKVDVILYHEATHFLEGHLAEIEETLEEVTNQRHVIGAAKSMIRYSGTQRYAEWEADLSYLFNNPDGVVSPKEARDAFILLRNYAQTDESDAAHGRTLDRATNFLGLAKIRDYSASAKPVQDLPEGVLQFADSLSEAPLNDFILDLLIQLNKEDKFTDAHSQAIEDRFSNYHSLGVLMDALKMEVLSSLSQKSPESVRKARVLIKRALRVQIKTQIEEDLQKSLGTQHVPDNVQQALVQSILCLGLGIDPHDAQQTLHYNSFMEAVEELDSYDDLVTSLNLLTPELLTQLNLFIYKPQDVIPMIRLYVSHACECELFDDDGVFDTSAYIDYCLFVFNKFSDLMKACGFEPIHTSYLTEALLENPLLELDLKQYPHHLGELLDSYVEKGIRLNPAIAYNIIQAQAHINLDDQQKTDIHQKLLNHDPLAKIYNLDLEDSERQVSSDNTLERVDRKSAQVKLKTNAHLLNELPQSFTELFETLHWLLNQFEQDLSVSGVKPLDVIFDLDGEMNHGIMNYVAYATFALLIYKCLLEGLPGVLPDDASQRTQVVLALIKSLDNKWADEFLGEEFDLILNQICQSEEPGENNLFDSMKRIQQVLDGTSPLYEEYSLIPSTFDPHMNAYLDDLQQRLSLAEYKSVHLISDEMFHEKSSNYQVGGFSDASLIVRLQFRMLEYLREKAPQFNKTELATSLIHFIDWVSSYASNLPSRLARGEDDPILYAAEYVSGILDSLNLDFTTKEGQDIWMALGWLSGDSLLNMRVHDAVFQSRFDGMSFEDRVNWVLLSHRTNRLATTEQRRRLIEKDAQTPEQIQNVMDAGQEFLDQNLTADTMGGLVLLERFTKAIYDPNYTHSTRMKKPRPIDHLRLLMEMDESDLEIKVKIFQMTFVGQRCDLEVAVYKAERMVRELASAPDSIRHGVVRQLLIGEEGLLLTQDGRHELIDYFLEKHAVRGDSDYSAQIEEVMREVMYAAFDTAAPDVLYGVVADILVTGIMKQPSHKADWQDVMMAYYFGLDHKEKLEAYTKGNEKFAEHERDEHLDRGYLDSDAIEELDLVRYHRIQEVRFVDQSELDLDDSEREHLEELRKQYFSLNRAQYKDQYPQDDEYSNEGNPYVPGDFEYGSFECSYISDYYERLSYVDSHIEDLNKALRGEKVDYAEEASAELATHEYWAYRMSKAFEKALGTQDTANQSEKSPLTFEELALKLVQGFGTPGVRLVQIMGLFIDIPDEIQDLFRDAYDNVYGQSKLTAWDTIQRYWKNSKRDLVRIVKRVGGGSLMTTYLCEVKDPETGEVSEQAVKVLNPNALMFNDMAIDVIKRALQSLAKQIPERYAAIIPLVDQIDEWIRSDILYDGFVERDAQFRIAHHQSEVGVSGARLVVPVSYAVPSFEGKSQEANRRIKREDFSPGTTLTRVEGHDGEAYKKSVAAITQSYVQQILTGHAHSDVHPGNYMQHVTPEGEVVVVMLDRNFFLELNDQDRALMSQVMSLASSPDATAGLTLMDHLYGYLETEGEQEISESVRMQLNMKVFNLVAEHGTDYMKIITEMLRTFHKHDIKVPLKLVLFIKNFQGLELLAQQAGFGSVQEAYEYPQSLQ